MIFEKFQGARNMAPLSIHVSVVSLVKID